MTKDEFQREERYIVFKLSDVADYFYPSEISQLLRLSRTQQVMRERSGKPPLECVVVESDWPEYEPTWKAIEARVMGAQPAPSEKDEPIRKAWARFSNALHRSPDAPYPGMSEAFEKHFSQSFTDREWRAESGTWAAAWKAAKNHGAQPAPSPRSESAQPIAERTEGPAGFDPAAFDAARNDTIEASRNAGNLHLDQLPAYVEGMRGREIYDVHNPDVRGVIDTVDNNRTVYVIRNDGTRDRLVPSDFKDYVVAPTEKADVKTLRALRKKADDKQSAEREAAAAQERARVNAEYADLVEASRRVRPMLDRAMAGTAAEREIAQAFVDGQIDVEDFIAEMGVNGTAVAPSGNSDASSAEPAPAQAKVADKPKTEGAI